MEIVTGLVQGSAEWHAHRGNKRNASDSPKVTCDSSYGSRESVMAFLKFGHTEEVPPELQKRFDLGHLFEKLARPLAEDITGEMLSPETGVNGEYSASFDGLDFDRKIAFEHKTLNAKLREEMFDGCQGTDLPMEYQVQMETQCLVCESLEKVLFMASVWDEETHELIEERHCWYTPNLKLRAQITAAWDQLIKDMVSFEMPEVKAVAVAEAIPSLPALNIELFGEVKGSNLPSFATSAKQVIESIKTDLVTDQDFADSEAIVKFLKSGEQQLAEAKKTALSKTESIEALFRAVDDLSETMRQKRLTLEKLVKAEKENKRNAIFSAAKQELTDHIQKLNASFSIRVALPDITTDFTGAMKGKKLLSSMQSSVNDVLAKAKIEANQWAEKITANINAYTDAVKEEYRALLFPDLPTLILKDQDDFIAYVNNRIAMHEQQIREREELARKQAEESARLKAEADEATRLEAEARRIAQDAQDAQRMAEAEALAKNPAPALADIPLTTGAAMKAAAQSNDQVTLFDALTQFCNERGLNESTCNDLISLVGSYTSLNQKAAQTQYKCMLALKVPGGQENSYFNPPCRRNADDRR